MLFVRFLLTAALCAFLCRASVVSEDSKLLAFQRWFAEKGGVAQGVDVAAFPAMGNGVRALKEIREGELVLRVPYHLIFSHASLLRLAQLTDTHTDTEEEEEALPISDEDSQALNLINKFFNAQNDAAGRERALLAWLLRERELGEESFYFPYIHALPQYVSSALHFSAAELAELQSPSVAGEILQSQKETREEFAQFMRIVDESRGMFPYLESVSFADYLWAATVFHSRGLRFRGEVHLTPFADMFNYAPHTNTRAAQSGEFFLKHHVLDADTGSLAIYADREALKGAQLCEDYGDNTNEIYLKYHGFVPRENPFHCVNLQFARDFFLNNIASKLSSAQKEVLQRLRFPAESPLAACVTAQGEMSQQMVVYLSILSFSQDEAQQCLNTLNDVMNASKRNKKKAVDWPAIFRGCAFDRVAVSFASFNTKKSLDVLAAGTEEETETLTLTARVLSSLQTMLASSTEAQRFATSLSEDAQLLYALESELSTLTDTEQQQEKERQRALLHTLIAVQYRMANKRIFGTLCALYDASCDATVSLSAATNSNANSLENAALPTERKLTSPEEITQTRESERKSESGHRYHAIDLFSTRDPSTLDDDLALFNSWFLANNPSFAKIRAVSMPDYRIGTVASESIRREEIYLGVPQRVVLSAERAFEPSSGVHALLQALSQRYQSRRDDFHELLVFLVYEALVRGRNTGSGDDSSSFSFYWPYLNLLPRLSELDTPMLWNESLVHARLAPSHIVSQIENYQQSVRKKFDFFRAIPEVHEFFAEKWGFPLTEEVYRWASAILDSRSIWWEGKRHLVPMLDFVNCKEQESDRNRVHSTTLDDKKENAVTRADGDYEVGEQLFENYGQPNNIYFLYHGFSLLSNSHDCVHHEFSLSPNEYKQLSQQEINRRILQNLRVSPEDHVFTSCLQLPISAHTWAFLSLKTNTHYDLLDSRKLGSPTREAAEVLIREIEQRIENYERFGPVDHVMTQQFLDTEESILRAILADLKKSVKTMPRAVAKKTKDDDNEEL